MAAVIKAVTAEKVASLKTYKASELSTGDLLALTARPRIDFTSILDTVTPIVEDVRKRGDAAVKEFTARFDGVDLSSVCVPIEELADPEISAESKEAFDIAYENIKAFHEAQRSAPLEVETMPGVRCRRVTRPIGAVGIYVPGGTAVLPSSTLMMAVPAQIAGCRTVVMATPPRKDGQVTPEVLYCAKKAGVTHVLKAGGAQAVDKLLGPGNQYVTAAKMLLQNSEAMVSIDMPAGPSEVLVIADAEASPAHVAADLLSQAEHGPDSQVVLVALPGVDLAAVEDEVDRQCDALPRGDVARKALSHSCIVVAKDKAEAANFSNMYAPEHLIVNVEDAEDWLPLLDNAGSVFLGRWTPESVGDYASGTNHVLPTYGYARMYSGVSLDTFQKKMTVQSLTLEGLRNVGPAVAHMAAVEGLDAHRRAVTMRLGLPN
ncbi:histidinol dehydrogenase [Coccomyxa subellipsoidea C-169]|uniref:Histidinol dehydrogenase, chloroplastic n=1 Tax=Coccomyxa subellipsoidea (strain C-169) TaxID=574566 RepID=I0Z7Q4_COCSC|nr:histidinol dehydrogenase [Coccomyxa subellipsoidea C-169]EIE26673.1 histidinol dehydrogenase [Coccomyxa subellipsoidea C-169]|eukprot:XP_005651217.1 histidinol dehydrogenase [Coccomyxa subellipsoidea C-169]